MLKVIAYIVVILVIGLLGLGLYLGIHNPVNVKKADAGPYHIVCVDHIGPYKDINKKIQNVKKILDERKIVPIAACGLYYDDPKTVSSDKLRSKAGYLVNHGTEVEILEKLDIPRREIVLAVVRAHPAIAPIKVYPKINNWLSVNNFVPAGPCLEIYHNNRVVEVQMPISPKKE